MIKKKHVVFFIFFLSQISLGCDWCQPITKKASTSLVRFFIEQYLTYLNPSIDEMIGLYKTMCIDACLEGITYQAEQLARSPSRYFHVLPEQLAATHLVKAHKTFEKLLYFLHGNLVDVETKKIIPYFYTPNSTRYLFVSQYLDRYGKKDIFGCSLLHDLHAYALSFTGTLFNSMLLKNNPTQYTEEEKKQLIYLFNTLTWIVNSLAKTPYQTKADEQLAIWKRIFTTIQKEWIPNDQPKKHR